MPKPTDKIIEESLRVLWELMPDNLARGGNETFYDTQVEPHIRKTISQALAQRDEEILKFCDELKDSIHKDTGAFKYDWVVEEVEDFINYITNKGK